MGRQHRLAQTHTGSIRKRVGTTPASWYAATLHQVTCLARACICELGSSRGLRYAIAAHATSPTAPACGPLLRNAAHGPRTAAYTQHAAALHHRPRIAREHAVRSGRALGARNDDRPGRKNPPRMPLSSEAALAVRLPLKARGSQGQRRGGRERSTPGRKLPPSTHKGTAALEALTLQDLTFLR